MNETLTPAGTISKDMAVYEQEANSIAVNDASSARSALLFVARCREAEKTNEAERKSITDPLRADIDTITKEYNVTTKWFERLRGGMLVKISVYEAAEEKIRLEAQRKAIADADALRIKKAKEEEVARVAAECARAAGDLLAALKLDTKADKAALVAATAVPVVLEAPPKTVTFSDGTSVTNRKGKDYLPENGLSRESKYYHDDARCAVFPDNVWLLDWSKIGAIVRAGGTVPGVRVFETSTKVTKQT